jgi:hypothetical protein
VQREIDERAQSHFACERTTSEIVRITSAHERTREPAVQRQLHCEHFGAHKLRRTRDRIAPSCTTTPGQARRRRVSARQQPTPRHHRQSTLHVGQYSRNARARTRTPVAARPLAVRGSLSFGVVLADATPTIGVAGSMVTRLRCQNSGCAGSTRRDARQSPARICAQRQPGACHVRTRTCNDDDTRVSCS